MPAGFVYILGSHSGTLYIGVTSNLYQRVMEHRTGVRSGFATKYGCTRLLYKEEFTDIRNAIAREKQLKGWTRAKKLALIATSNPGSKDLAEQWGWQMIGSQQNIAEEERKLDSRFKLPDMPKF
ncbi:MAG: GIY-YIG nuclease family protein [Acidobacteriaceae bacterium]